MSHAKGPLATYADYHVEADGHGGIVVLYEACCPEWCAEPLPLACLVRLDRDELARIAALATFAEKLGLSEMREFRTPNWNPSIKGLRELGLSEDAIAWAQRICLPDEVDEDSWHRTECDEIQISPWPWGIRFIAFLKHTDSPVSTEKLRLDEIPIEGREEALANLLGESASGCKAA